MHTDTGSNILKAMFYLKDVGPEDAPFSYIPGSHHWKRSLLVTAFQCALDKQQSYIYDTTKDGLDYASHYYRPLYANEEGRSDVLSLPRILRGSTHFGDDVQDGTPLSQDLLSLEKKFMSPAGTIILFDGARGIHRGAVSNGGHRWAIQLGFRIANPEAPRHRPLWKRMLRPLNPYRLRLLHAAGLLRDLISPEGSRT